MADAKPIGREHCVLVLGRDLVLQGTREEEPKQASPSRGSASAARDYRTR